MSDVKAKVLELFKFPTLVGLATIYDSKPWVRYVMATADDQMIFRIATSGQSRKVAQIKNNPEVHMTGGIASLETAKHYAQIQGQASIVTDNKEKAAFWTKELSAYFSGPEDPNYCLIVIKPYHIELMSMMSIAPEIWES